MSLCQRVVRMWAKKRGIYGNKWGYLGGVNCNILVAFVCQLYPKASPSKLLASFFKVSQQTCILYCTHLYHRIVTRPICCCKHAHIAYALVQLSDLVYPCKLAIEFDMFTHGFTEWCTCMHALVRWWSHGTGRMQSTSSNHTMQVSTWTNILVPAYCCHTSYANV